MPRSDYKGKYAGFIGFIIISLLFSSAFEGGAYAQDENLSVLSRWLKYSDKENVLYHHLADQAFKYLDKRKAEIAQLSSEKQWKERQKKISKTLMDIIGPFPEKTPLNARILDTIKKNGLRVEKIIYESRPEFYVTACLFLPEKLENKKPAIIYCSGHSGVAFRSVTYQKVILNLVKKGFIVFAFDPIGQGERLQYYDPDFAESKIGGPTLEHSYPGAQCFLIGSSVARYMIWDGIRAVDYLLTRDEVDPHRIGITGRSGGGTQSSYIAAFDDRILAAAPECYITSFTRLLESIGPQDAEQNFYHGLANGIDHADLLEVRTPRPAFLITTTRDFFSIQGVRETNEEIKKAYQAFGKSENIQQVEDDAAHASTVKNRESMYAFFQKFLKLPGNSTDQEVDYLSPEELRVTSTGQIMTSLGGKTAFSINAAEAEQLLSKIDESRKNLNRHLQRVKTASVNLSGFEAPEEKIDAVFTGRYQRDGYSIEKYYIQGEGDYPVPFLFVKPDGSGPFPVVIYLHPNGKGSESNPQGEIAWFVRNGFSVIAPDFLGQGEVGPGIFKGDAYNFKPGKAYYNLWFLSIQIARSLTGIHAGDVIRLVNYIKGRDDVDSDKIYAIAKEEMCPLLAHAANFNNAISRIAFIEPLVSYRSVVLNKYYEPHHIPGSVAGMLNVYDLPDLYASLAPRKLLMVNTVNQIDQRLDMQILNSEMGVLRSAYESADVAENLVIRNWEEYQSMDNLYSDWLNSR